MTKGVKAGAAYISISADLSGLKKGADSAKKVLAGLKASLHALGKGNIGTSLTLGIHSIGTAVSAIGGKLKTFGTSLSAFGRGVMAYGSKMMAFAGIGMTGVAFVTKRFIELGDALNKMSARTNATVEWLSAMAFATERSGATIEILEQAIRKLNKAIAEAQKGNRTPYEAFSKLRIDPNSMQFKNLDAGAQFELVARRLHEVQSQAEKTRLAMALFEESGTMLLPLLGDIYQLKQKAKELGIIITKDQADLAAALLDAWTNLKYQLNAIFMSLGEAIAPALKQVATWLSKMVKPIQKFVSQHRELFIMMAKGLALFLVLGGVIVSVGAVSAGLGIALKAIGSALIFTGGIIKGFAVTIGAVLGLVWKATSGIIGFAKVVSRTVKAMPAFLFVFTHPWMATVNAIIIATGALNLFARRLTNLGPTMNKFSIRMGKMLLGALNILNPFTWARNFMTAFSIIRSELMKTWRVMAAFPVSTWAWLAGIVAVVGAVGYIIYKTNALGKLWQWLKSVWQDTCNFFVAKWNETTSAIGDSFSVIWEAALLGNFKQAWSLLCKDMLVTWNIWTLEISDTWDSLISMMKNGWASLWYGAVIKAYDWASNRILTGLEYIKDKFAYGWEWIAGSCKVAFRTIVVWIQNAFDEMITGVQKALNRMKALTPGTGYKSYHADFDNQQLDRGLERRKAERESEIGRVNAGSDEKLAQIERQTSERIGRLNKELEQRMKMYEDIVASMHDENDAELVAEMQRRRQDIERLKQEIARETEDLRAKNEEMKRENEVTNEDYYKVWEDIKDNTAETATNTAQMEATADVNASAITVKWGGLGVFANIIANALRNISAMPKVASVPVPTKPEQEQLGASVVPETDKTKLAEIGIGVNSIREVLSAQANATSEGSKSMSDKMQRLLDKLTELTRNSKKYSENIEEMLTAR